MAINVSGKVWELDLPAVDKLVLLALTDHADSEGKNIRPGNALLCAKTGLSERTITAKIAAFIEQGILEPTHDTTGRGHVREFEVHLEGLPRHRHFVEKDREKAARRSTFKRVSSVKKVESDDIKVEADAQKVESDDSALIRIEPSRTVKESPANTPPAISPDISLALEELYPGHSTNYRLMMELVTLVSKFGGSAADVRKFPAWLSTTHPKKGNTVFAFKDFFHESLTAPKPTTTAPAVSVTPDWYRKLYEAAQ